MPRADELPALAPEVEQTLTDNNVTDETRYMARKYFSAWGKPSQHLDSGYIQNWQQLMLHAKGEEEARVVNSRIEEREGRNAARKAREARSAQGAEWLAWQNQCTQRNAWIEEANAEWRKRVAAMNAAMLQWKTHVEEARTELARRKATPAPEQPKR